ALGGVDDERAFAQRDAGEAAGHDLDRLAIKNVGPEIDVPTFDGVAADGRTAGEPERGLGDEIAGVRRDFAAKFLDLGAGGMRADEHAVAAGLVDAFDDEAGEV